MKPEACLMKEKKIQLNKTLPALLESRRITIKELSQLTSISSSTLYEWKNGRTPKNIYHLKMVSELLNVSLHYLLYKENDPFEVGAKGNITMEGTYNIIVKKTGDIS